MEISYILFVKKKIRRNESPLIKNTKIHINRVSNSFRCKYI